MITINELLDGKYKIEKPDQKDFERVKKSWDMVAKPLDSMGRFETITSKMGAITGDDSLDFQKKIILIFCADNGIVYEGISQSEQDVTLAVTKAMGQRKSSVCKMAAHIGADVRPIDIGINSSEEIDGVLNKKVRMGTRDFMKEPAMTRLETLKAIQTGMDMVYECKNQGYKVIGTGEMGIGNTTTSCAIAAALLGVRAKEIVGRGAGLSDNGLEKKEEVVQAAIDIYGLYGANPLKVLEVVGGLDIAALTGVVIGGAVYHIPIILDGVITLVAALVATRMFENVREYIIASHIGREPAIKMLLKELRLEPVICADLALGEGTGAVMFCSLLDMALTLYDEDYTFKDIEIKPYHRFDCKQINNIKG
ncbi:MAG: nicotinate-nucleotide--dimethylbenzimidazole phosphoribosyltransferase [Lachnospiraceae bacterium]|nr:nicotinate-nucleotide--dimethylbenzimidazole phosphoribosyltransferase [Lachnospiraceae bacterium]